MKTNNSAIEEIKFEATAGLELKDRIGTIEDYIVNPKILLDDVAETTVLSYECTKEMYSPSCFDILMQIKMRTETVDGKEQIKDACPTYKELEEIFMCRRATIILTSEKDSSVVIPMPDMYVTEVEPTFSAGANTTIQLRLKLHTPDYFINIDNYCKAYTARQLCNEIVKTELGHGTSEEPSLLKQIKDKEDDVNDKEGDVKYIERRINDKEIAIAQKEKEIADKKQAITDKQIAIDEKKKEKEELEDVEKKKKNIKQEITNKENEIKNKETEITDKQNRITKETSKKNEIEDKIKEIDNEIAKKDITDGRKKELETQKTELQKEKEEIEHKIKTRENEKTTLENEKTTLEKQKEELQKQYDDYKKDDKEINKLKSEIETLEKEKTTLETQNKKDIETLEADIKTLKEEKQKLEKEKEEPEKILKEAQDELDELKDKNKTIELANWEFDGIGFTTGKIGKLTVGANSYNTYSDKYISAILKFNCDNLQRLGYKSEDKNYELIQPYLVQYNESFYSFIRRTANRCGEFLFYEDTDSERSKKTSNSKYCMHIGLPNLDITRFSDDKDDIKNGINSLGDYSYSYTGTRFKIGKHIAGNQIAYTHGLMHKSYDEGEVYNEKSYYDYDTPFEELLETVLKKEGKVMPALNTPSNWINMVMGAVSKRTLLEMITSWGISYGFNYSRINNKIVDNVDGAFNDNNINKYAFKHKDEQVNTSATEANQFSTLKNSLVWDNYHFKLLDLGFYSNNYEKGEEAKSGCIHLNLESNYIDIRLGDKVHFNGSDYIAIKICYSADNAKRKLEVDLLPLLKEGGKEVAYPIPLESNKRHTAPQTAFISDVKDPFSMGRVRIRYPWQRAYDSASPWIRVAAPMASNDAGFDFKPCEGDEVLLNYENDNIERPYVAGYLFNGKNKLSTFDANYNIPNTTTRSIKSVNGHSIVFRDPGKNSFFWNLYPGTDFLNGMLGFAPKFESNADTERPLSGGISLTNDYGLYSIDCSADKRAITISSPLGNVSLNAFTGITISAPNGNISIKGKNVSIEAGNQVSIKSGTNITSKTDEKGALNAVCDIFGISKDSAFKHLQNIASDLSAKFFDLSLLRTIIETFLKPVGGTMQLKSNRHLQLAAGKGSIETPIPDYGERLETDRLTDHATANLIRSYGSEALLIAINYAIKTVDNAHKNAKDLGEQIRVCELIFNKINPIVHNSSLENDDINIGYKTNNDIKDLVWDNDELPGYENFFNSLKNKLGPNAQRLVLNYNTSGEEYMQQQLSLDFRWFGRYFSAYAKELYALAGIAHRIKTTVADGNNPYIKEGDAILTPLKTKIDNVMKSSKYPKIGDDNQSIIESIVGNTKKGIGVFNDKLRQDYTLNKMKVIDNENHDNINILENKRQYLYMLLTNIVADNEKVIGNKYAYFDFKPAANDNANYSQSEWRRFVYGITIVGAHITGFSWLNETILGKMVSAVSLNTIIAEGEKFVDLHERAIWTPQQAGELTFSTKSGETLHIKDGQGFEPIKTGSSHRRNRSKIRNILMSI